jgi:DNA-binding GntR family transcriptional regulator
MDKSVPTRLLSGQGLRAILENSEYDEYRLTGKAGRVYAELERRLTRGEYKFGQNISVLGIAKSLRVSRQPVMTALSQLRAAGYIVITPQVGCRVITPTEQEIADFFRLFASMEGVMVRLATERCQPGDLELLRYVATECRAVKVEPGHIPPAYAELVGAFHDVIHSMARTPHLTQRVRSFWRMSDFLLWNGEPNVQAGAIEVAHSERDAIVEAIATGDADRAARLMDVHVRHKPVRVGIVPSQPET